MIVWTDSFPKRKRFLGYFRLCLGRYRYFVHYGLRKGKRLGLGMPHLKPGYQMWLRSLRDKHKGQRCFVIGNGPSLRSMDLSHLRSELTIGCNAIYKEFGKWGWHTDYLLFEDTEQTELRGPELSGVKGPTKMASIYNAYAFRADEDTLLFNARRADPHYWENLHPRFSDEFEHIVYLGSTVTYIGLQLAFHLGCDPVYLIGVDHNYGVLPELFPPGKIEVTQENYHLVQQCHFDKNYYKIGDVIGVPPTKLQEAAYAEARRAYDTAGRRIFNAGVDSKLEVFEKCDYESLFNGPAARKKRRVLFISHAATVSGAPLSFRILMRYFKEHADWDMRILVRKRNGPLEPYSEIAPSKFFYNNQPPRDERPTRPSTVRVVTRELRRFATRQHTLQEALSSIMEHINGPRKAGRQQATHEARLCEEIRSWAPELVYSNTAVNGDVIDKLSLDGVPVVVHVRELATAFATLPRERIDAFVQRPLYYFAVSDAVRQYITQTHGIPDDNIELAPVALECDAIVALAEKESVGSIRKKKLPFGDKDILIGGMGYLNARKGADLFVEVARRTLDAIGEEYLARFVWLGEGEDLNALRERVKELGIDKHVVFAGLQRNPYPYLRALDFVLMTSRDDPFPRVNLEAAVFGKPIICFADSGGSKEFAADDCGLVVPGLDVDAMTERCIELVKNREFRERLGRNAREKVRNRYDVNVVAPAVQARLESLLTQGIETR